MGVATTGGAARGGAVPALGVQGIGCRLEEVGFSCKLGDTRLWAGVP